MVLIAEGSFLAILGMSLLCGFLGVGLIFTGLHAIRTKTANARKLEKLMANRDGQITGPMAVFKGYVLLLGGIVLAGMAIFGLGAGIYKLIVG